MQILRTTLGRDSSVLLCIKKFLRLLNSCDTFENINSNIF